MKNKNNCYCYNIINNKLYALNRQGKLFTAQKSLKSLAEIYNFSCFNLACITYYLNYLIVIGVDGNIYYYSIENNAIEHILELNNTVVTPPVVVDSYLIVQTDERLVSIHNFKVIASNNDILQHMNMKGISLYKEHIIAYKESSLLFLYPQNLSIINELNLLPTYIWSKASENDFYITYHTYGKFIVIDKKSSKIVFSEPCKNKRNFHNGPIIANKCIIYFDKNSMNIIYPKEKFKVVKYKCWKSVIAVFILDDNLFFIRKNRILRFNLNSCKYFKKDSLSVLLNQYKKDGLNE